jgi:chromosome segregation ATPase
LKSQEKADLIAELETARPTIAELRTQVEQLTKDLEEAKNYNEAFPPEQESTPQAKGAATMAEKDIEIERLTKKSDTLDVNVKKLRKKCNKFEAKCQQLEINLTTAETKNNLLEAQIKTHEGNIKLLTKERDAAQKRVEELDPKKIEAELRTYQNQRDEYKQEKERESKRCHEAILDTTKMREERDKMREEHKKMSELAEERLTTIKKMRTELDNANETLKKLQCSETQQPKIPPADGGAANVAKANVAKESEETSSEEEEEVEVCFSFSLDFHSKENRF